MCICKTIVGFVFFFFVFLGLIEYEEIQSCEKVVFFRYIQKWNKKWSFFRDIVSIMLTIDEGLLSSSRAVGKCESDRPNFSAYPITRFMSYLFTTKFGVVDFTIANQIILNIGLGVGPFWWELGGWCSSSSGLLVGGTGKSLRVRRLLILGPTG